MGGYSNMLGGDYCPPTGWTDPAKPTSDSPDPNCASGIKGTGLGPVCCASSCGTCVAACENLPGGPGACCPDTIWAANMPCSESPPPCINPSRRLQNLGETWAPATNYPMIFMQAAQVDEFVSTDEAGAVQRASDASSPAPSIILLG